MTATAQPDRVPFVQQYDRLFVLTFGLVNVIRGLGGLAAFAVDLTGGGRSGASSAAQDGGAAGALGLLALLHAAVLLGSGAGLLLRRRWGWTLSVAFHSYELGKLGGALLLAAVLGGVASIQAGTELLVQMAWALFSLLVFLLAPIARLCRVEGSAVRAGAPWMLTGALLSAAKLAAVVRL